MYRLLRQFERYGDVGKLVLSNVRRFCSGKKPSDDVFSKITVRWQVGTRHPLTISSLTCARRNACVAFSADDAEQAPERLHAGSQRQGVPYLQRVGDAGEGAD